VFSFRLRENAKVKYAVYRAEGGDPVFMPDLRRQLGSRPFSFKWYPEFKALVAQIETMLAHASTGAREQTVPQEQRRTDASVAQPSEGAFARTRGRDAQDQAQDARRKKIRDLVGFILIPSAVLVLAAAAGTALRADRLWRDARAAVLASIAAWALAFCAGAYRLYKDFAPA
jgi:hypothetical protein